MEKLYLLSSDGKEKYITFFAKSRRGAINKVRKMELTDYVDYRLYEIDEKTRRGRHHISSHLCPPGYVEREVIEYI